MKRKFGIIILRISTTLNLHLYKVESQNLSMSSYLYIEMLIRLVCGSQDVSQAENKVRLVLAAM